MAVYRIAVEQLSETVLSPNMRPAPWYVGIVRDANDREVVRTRSHLLQEDAYSEAVRLKDRCVKQDKQGDLVSATSPTDEAAGLPGT